jgi:hypothetical protein
MVFAMKPLQRLACGLLATTAIATGLLLLPGRAAIAPHIQADNNYLFLAADRLWAGHGPTTPYPHAPFQYWEWRSDWGFLTQWPVGYPLLLVGMRAMGCSSSLQAAQVLAVIACAVALVGWFVWACRVLPRGPASMLLAVVVAASAVSTAALVNPATDILLVALLPLVLLLLPRFAPVAGCACEAAAEQRALSRLIIAGALAGFLFWVRYASIFVPAGVGLFLVFEWCVGKRVTVRKIAAFALGSALPVLTLLAINHWYSSASTLQERFNLGLGWRVSLDAAIFATAWWNFTDLPFYNYHWFSHWVFALVIPVGAIGLALSRPAWRRSLVQGPYRACVFVSLTLLVTLILATVLFRDKFEYVALSRYYMIAKPLYLLLFVGPVIAIPSRVVRSLASVPLLLCLSWFVQVEWPRPYKRWLAADRPRTDYGRWARCFEPGSTDLYSWLSAQAGEDLIVFSNFPDEIALETWIPACPLPRNERILRAWVERIQRARGIADPRLLFVLDPSNHSRAYYLPSPQRVVSRFCLRPDPELPYVHHYESRSGSVPQLTASGPPDVDAPAPRLVSHEAQPRPGQSESP